MDLVPDYANVPGTASGLLELPRNLDDDLLTSSSCSLTRIWVCGIGAALRNVQTAANARHYRGWPLGFSFGIRYERGWFSAEK